MSFAIANNLLAPNIRAIDLRISPRAIAPVGYNSFENFEDGYEASQEMFVNHPR